MSNVAINIAAEYTGKPAFDKANKAVVTLERNVKRLAAGLGAGIGVTAFTAYGKAAVKAFADDEAAARRLATAVDNLGLSFFNADVATFISQTEASAGILDDQLRPAMQALLTTTGSLINSQKLLNDAIQISRASGIDLATVAQDLANGYVGITRGLKKYNTGLTQAELKSKSFNEILGVMLAKSAGAAQAYLTTTAYKMDVLNVAAANAKETVGAGLVDAFARLSGGSGASDAAKTIDNIAKSINAVTTAASFAVSAVAKLYRGLDFLTSFGGLTGANGSLASMLEKKPSTNRSASPAGTYARTKQQSAAEAAAAKRAAALQKAQVKATKALTDEQKKQLALKKAGTVFDLEQIQLVAALKGNLSKEERTRVEAMAAILNENDALAQSLTKQILMAQDSSGNLYKYFLTIGNAKINNPFAFLDTWLTEFSSKLNATLQATKTAAYSPAGLAPELAAIGVVAGYGAGVPMSIANQASNIEYPSYGMQTAAAPAGNTFNIRVEGNVVTEQQLVDAIESGLQKSSLSGSPSQIGRLYGMFG